MGLIAFIILITWLFNILARAIELVRSTSTDSNLRSASVVLVALCAYQLLLMNKQGELWSSQNTIVYFLLLAKVSIATRNEMSNDIPFQEPEPVTDKPNSPVQPRY
jgi:hypothetical protein